MSSANASPGYFLLCGVGITIWWFSTQGGAAPPRPAPPLDQVQRREQMQRSTTAPLEHNGGAAALPSSALPFAHSSPAERRTFRLLKRRVHKADKAAGELRQARPWKELQGREPSLAALMQKKVRKRRTKDEKIDGVGWARREGPAAHGAGRFVGAHMTYDLLKD